MAANQDAFFAARDFPGVAGLIDGTHIAVLNPGGPFGETYRNRKRYFSINTQIVCGPRKEIFDIVARWPGSTHDSRIFDNSRVRMRFETGRLTRVLIGDSGYPGTTFLLTPLLNPRTPAEERYNRAHKRVRNIVECCNGELKRRMLCLHKGLAYAPEKVNRIICACAVLHNIAVKVNDPVPDDVAPAAREVPVRPVVQPQRGPAAAFRRAFIARHFQ